jgi:hypothetical protein
MSITINVGGDLFTVSLGTDGIVVTPPHEDDAATASVMKVAADFAARRHSPSLGSALSHAATAAAAAVRGTIASEIPHGAGELEQGISGKESRNCGNGAGGFKAGNKCALGSDGIPDAGDLEHETDLGGSTGARLMADAAGRKFVVKQGNSPGHIISENLADRLYEAMGVPVPAGKMSKGEDGQPAKVAEYVEGTPLAHLPRDEKPAAYAKLREHFVADALLANWDVIGLAQDNIIVDKNGAPHRIDNGGSLKYRAQGADKPFGPEVGEIDSMRKSNQGKPVFGSLTDVEIAGQVAKIVAKKDKILAVAAGDREVQATLAKRIDYLAKRFPSQESRNCGDGAGGFKEKNTCAKGGDGEPASQSDRIGDDDALRAHEELFGSATPKSPSDVLRRYGWAGDPKSLASLDAKAAEFRKSLDENKQRSFAAAIAGIGMAIAAHPELKDIAVRATTIEEEVADAAGRGESPETVALASATSAYYQPKEDAITIVADVAGGDPMSREWSYLSGASSSPSPAHVGYHEAAHAMHFRNLREQSMMPRTGPISSEQWNALTTTMAATLHAIGDSSSLEILKAGDPREKLSRGISTYGATNPRETVAEYTAGVELGGIEPQKALDELVAAFGARIPKPPASISPYTAKLRKSRDFVRKEQGEQ